MGYVLTGAALAVTVFCLLCWALATEDDALPWLPAGLAAGLVLLLTYTVREVTLRRRLSLRHGAPPPGASRVGVDVHRSAPNKQSSSGSLRALQQRLTELTAAGAQQPSTHLEAYRLCEQYLAKAEEAIQSSRTAPDARFALHAGKERVRELRRHHLLAWARGEATRLTTEARKRVRVSDKVETAQKAVEVIDGALKIYPDDPELKASALGARDFVGALRVAHWVEMAERAAFHGRFRRAIARYRDALFYVSRAEMSDEARADTASRIYREIELLRARIATGERTVERGSAAVVRPSETGEADGAGQAARDRADGNGGEDSLPPTARAVDAPPVAEAGGGGV